MVRAFHNILSPKNTICRDLGKGLRPVVFIDWDVAAPGRRVHDVAVICWQHLDRGLGSMTSTAPWTASACCATPTASPIAVS